MKDSHKQLLAVLSGAAVSGTTFLGVGRFLFEKIAASGTYHSLDAYLTNTGRQHVAEDITVVGLVLGGLAVANYVARPLTRGIARLYGTSLPN